MENTLKGRRYICLVRCSTDQQTDTSIPDQLRLLNAFAREHEMVHAGGKDIILGGVSGSRPGAREDIHEIVRRKNEGETFEVILVQDLSRLTRSGSTHLGKIDFDLAEVDVEIVVATGNRTEGDEGEIVRDVSAYASKQYAKSISFAVARGQMSALQEGRIAHCLRPPYGIDRLYISMDGRPLHVLRNLPDGTQLRLHPETRAVLEAYPATKKGESSVHYRKQKSERIALIPGAEEQVSVVQRIFRRRLIDGWGNWRIAKELNDLGLKSPNGKPWGQQTIKLLLRNPVYVGRGIANRRTHSMYNHRSPDHPKNSKVGRKDWAKRKQPPTRQRPKSEWVETLHPALTDYFGSELRDLVIEYQARFLTGVTVVQPKVVSDKHVDSLFVLKGLLRSKQGGYPMTGRTQGTKEKPYRYYHVSTACRIPSSDQTMRRTIRAEPLEQAVLSAVRDVLADPERLRPAIEAELRRQIAASDSGHVDLDALRKQRQLLREKINFVIDELGIIGRDAAREKICQLEEQLTELDGRINVAVRAAGGEVDIASATEAVMKRVDMIGQTVGELPPCALRSLLAGMITRLEVDLETKAVEIQIAVPSLDSARTLGLGDKLSRTSLPEAQRDLAAIAAILDCRPETKDCYRCRRRAA
jgi:DNA invertase Pin-like site-specific DNA recombinase